MRNYWLNTAVGQLVLCAPREVMQSDVPAIVLIHGAFRCAADLAPWCDRLPNVILANLPGHGGAPVLSETSVAAWTKAFAEGLGQLRRPLLLVGESLGGLVALGVPGAQAVAIDPFFATDDLWPLQHTLKATAGTNQSRGLGPIFSAGQTYYHLLRARRADLIVGDIPLLPPRSLPSTPSLFRCEDAAQLGDGVAIHRLAGGHLQLELNPDRCQALIAARYSDLGADLQRGNAFPTSAA